MSFEERTRRDFHIALLGYMFPAVSWAFSTLLAWRAYRERPGPSSWAARLLLLAVVDISLAVGWMSGKLTAAPLARIPEGLLGAAPSFATIGWVPAIVQVGASIAVVIVMARLARTMRAPVWPVWWALLCILGSTAAAYLGALLVFPQEWRSSLLGSVARRDAFMLVWVISAAAFLRAGVRCNYLDPPSWDLGSDYKGLGLGLLYVLAFGARAGGLGIIVFAVTPLGTWLPAFDPWSRIVDSGTPGTFLFAAAALVLAPLGEEMLYRGLLQGWLERFTPVGLAIALPSCLFSVQHIAQGGAFLGTLAVGIALGWLRARTRSLAAPLFIHTVLNGLVVLVRVMHASLAGGKG